MIGEGAYVCVYKPPIKCKDKSKYLGKKYIGKMFADKNQYLEEIEIMKIIKRIDPKSIYTTKLIDNCNVDINTRDYKECKHVNLKRTNYHQIIYRYGGKDLCYLLKSKYDIFDILPGMIHLLKFLCILAKNGYVHRDIKESNILYEGKKFFLIDFGLMIPFRKVYDEDQDYVLQYNYEYYPPEFKIYYNSKISTHFTSIKDVYKFTLSDVKQNYIDTNIMMDLDKIKESIQSLYKQDISTEIIKGSLMYYVDKIDIFAYGMVMMKIVINSDNKTDNKTKLEVYDILTKCIDPSPIHRPTGKEILKELTNLM
jgi:serine/threonine protein kinase